METGILVTLFLLAVVFGAAVLGLVVYTVKRETRRGGDSQRVADVDDDPRPPVER